jgi:hypothetical protein
MEKALNSKADEAIIASFTTFYEQKGKNRLRIIEVDGVAP